MKIAIVYNSETGITKKAAEEMETVFRQRGHSCTVEPIGTALPDKIAKADLICLGSWTAGLLLFLQGPAAGYREFVAKLPDLQGKKTAVFCTYKIATGRTLRKMAGPLREKGATVIGEFKYRGPKPDERFHAFAAALA